MASIWAIHVLIRILPIHSRARPFIDPAGNGETSSVGMERQRFMVALACDRNHSSGMSQSRVEKTSRDSGGISAT